MDEEVLEASLRQYRGVVSSSGGRRYWERNASRFSPSMRTFLEDGAEAWSGTAARSGDLPAVDRESRTRHESRFVGREIGDHRGDLLRLPDGGHAR